ncbi:MAG: hypothetical protein M1834_007768 [Cirrosporium novae-zelandiae]|nr:MAG: hypothetical protein M1834_007768 [Cirrosporium novae-zelandiae]
MAKNPPPELSDYEKQRLANIAERDALLKKLALDAASAGLAPKVPPRASTPKEKTRKRKAAPKQLKEEAPRRHSSRLAGLTADSEVAKRKAEEEYQAVQDEARRKRQRVSDDMDLGDIVVAGKQWDKSDNFVDVFRRGARPYERTFGEDDIKETSDKELRSLRGKMSGLELYSGFEPNRIKITPERIYTMAFHPSPDKPLIFAGDKLGNLGIFDGSQMPSSVKKEEKIKQEEDDEEEAEEDDRDPEITAFHIHARTISSLQFHPANPTTLYTSSYDSSVRSLDLIASKVVEVYAPPSSDEESPISGIEVHPSNPNIIYLTTLDGTFGQHDLRTSSNNTTLYQLSEKKIGGFSLHPKHEHLVSTASLDRFLKIWDLRKISGKNESRLPALAGEHESRLSVSHANFNATGQVATASYDDTIKIHDFAKAGTWEVGHSLTDKEMLPKTTIRHNNQTGRWVTILRAQWQQHPSDGVQRFVIGNMNRFVDIYTKDGQQLAQLGGEGITAVPAVAQFHPTQDWVAGGTASGKLCLWM